MSSKGEELARHREQLLARVEAQRLELSVFHRQFEGPVRAIEMVLGFVNSLRRSPLVITGLVAVLIRTPWRKLARVPRWVWRVWKAFQFVRSWAR